MRDNQDVERAVRGGRSEWTGLYTRLYTNVAADFAKRIEDGLKSYTMVKTDDEWMNLVLQYLRREAGKRITGIESTTLKIVRDELAEGTRLGESSDQLAKRLREAYSLFSPMRSERIARTEVLTASERGCYAYAVGTGAPLSKEWITTIDGRERPWHADANGQTRPLEEPFMVNGELLDHPGDTSHGAGAGNVIQCRCTAGYIYKY